MAVEKWRLKRMLIAPFVRTPFGDALYEWLTAVLLGTQGGMSRKWCYWLREHLILTRRFGRVDIPGSRLWFHQPGWSLAPVVAGYAVSGRPVLVTEDRTRLARRYVRQALSAVRASRAQLGRAAGLAPAQVAALELPRAASGVRAVLQACRAEYHTGDLQSLDGLDPGSADVCISMGRLEHYSYDELRLLLAQMRRITRPGGVGSHIIDHRDHFWHFDKRIHCFHHLTYSDCRWRALAAAGKLYRNRLVESDYLDLFEKSGFRVLGCVHKLHANDAADVDPRGLWGPFKQIRAHDLEAAVSHIVVRRA